MSRLARGLDGTPLLGNTDGFVPLPAAHPDLDSVREALSSAAKGNLSIEDSSATTLPDENIRFARPLGRLGKLWGIGLNYADHAADLDETRPDQPASFMKPATTATGPGGPIRLPSSELTDRVTAEAELGVIIGRTAHDVDEANVDSVIAGYVPILDMTAEDILDRNPRYLTRAKSFDSFLVIGPWIETGISRLDKLEVRTVVNDSVRARNRVDNMLFSPRELVAFHSRVMTLEPGDLISTGTPGASTISASDTVRAEVDGIGTVAADVVRG